MKSSRYTKSRQKACQRCARAKVKCDQKPEGCTRCEQTGNSCNYAPFSVRQTPPSKIDKSTRNLTSKRSNCISGRSVDSRVSPAALNHQQLSANNLDRQAGYQHIADIETSFDPNSSSSTRLEEGERYGTAKSHMNMLEPSTMEAVISLDFTTLELVCPINASEICNRWLSAFVPNQDQPIKEYPPRVASFIFRMLKAYAGVGVHGHGVPPFVHWSQIRAPTSTRPLSACFSLIRTCDTLLPTAVLPIVGILQNEIQHIYEQHLSHSGMALLGTFQACLIYCLVLQFWLRPESDSFLRSAVMYMQEIACATSEEGLTTLAEQQGTRPSWESWIATETKRRTIYTMYLFDNVLSAQDGLPMCLGTKLQGLLAPASRKLWQARSRQEWERGYNVQLAAFPEGGLRIEELWPPSPDEDQANHENRRSRIDRWLEDLDEFGTMLYAVTSITHGV